MIKVNKQTKGAACGRDNCLIKVGSKQHVVCKLYEISIKDI